MHHEEYLVTWDNSHRSIKSEVKCDFLEAQIDKEVTTECYSEDSGFDHLPGMYCSPIHTIPKPGMDTLRLINNQSNSNFSPNSMISHDDIARTCMDSIKSLGASLHAFHWEHGDHVELIIYKSDIQGAYHNIPMAPLWQLKQAVVFEGQMHIDRCNCFGDRKSVV